jgi:dienelactone hydrolase
MPRSRSWLLPAIALLALGAGAAASATGPDAQKPKPAALAAPQKAALADLAARWWKARPATRFEDWKPAERAALEREARALGEIPEGSSAEVIELVWQAARKNWKKIPLERGKLVLESPYGKAWAYVTGSGKNEPLILGLHGGGEDAGSADEPRGTWQHKGALGIYPQGIKLVHDTWNTVHGERFLLSLIEIAKLQFEVDPDRVYVAGFSMGGTGSWFMAGRHPDLFAGASPCAGVFMASPKSQLAKKEQILAIQHGLVPNVRDLALWYFIGEEDDHCFPGTYLYAADMLERLRKDDPEGWQGVHFKTYPGLRHEFPKGEPEGALKFLFEQERQRAPATLVWEYAKVQSPEPDAEDKVTRIDTHAFYWLRCKEPQDRQWIRATRAKNAIELVCRGTAGGAKGLTICLDASLIDPAQDVVVTLAGAEVYRGKPKPDFWTILECMDERVERSMVFDRRIEL